MPVAVDVWYDPAYMATTIKIVYQRVPGDTMYPLSYKISDEYLHSVIHADVALAALICRIRQEYRVRLNLGEADLQEIEKACLIALTGKPNIYAPPREDTHYRDTATSEFEGVEDLDPLLWDNNEGGLL